MQQSDCRLMYTRGNLVMHVVIIELFWNCRNFMHMLTRFHCIIQVVLVCSKKIKHVEHTYWACLIYGYMGIFRWQHSLYDTLWFIVKSSIPSVFLHLFECCCFYETIDQLGSYILDSFSETILCLFVTAEFIFHIFWSCIFDRPSCGQ